MKWIIHRYGRYAHISRAQYTCSKLLCDEGKKMLQRNGDADAEDQDYAHHDLWKLWKVCKKVILEVGSDGETEGLLAVEQVVKDFHDLDKSSFSFRYSTDKKGVVIRLPDAPFDLENIKNVMEAVNNLFTGADGQLDQNSSGADR
jgi:hypothetical protein